MNGNSTRERILQIALHLFAQSGYEAVSVSDIAAQLGITKGALYRHYASKRDIFNSIVSRMAQMDAEQARECALPDGLAAEMPNAYRQASLAQLFAFCRVQFKYWTQAPFPADFRRMLTLEQYRSAEMNRLYQQYLGAGPLDYTAELLRAQGFTDVRQRALSLYAPMFFAYTLYDAENGAEAANALMEAHFSRLEAAWTTDERKC